MAINADLHVGVKITQDGALRGVPFKFNIEHDKTLSFTDGTDATTKANILYADTRTLAASATENLDLAGVLVDFAGATIAAAEIVAIYVEASAGNTNNVVIGNATSNAFVGPLGATGTYTLGAGEFVLMSSKNGWAVTATTGDLLKVANSAAGTPVTYKIVLLGRSVAA